LTAAEERDWQRLDTWLWCARFLRLRSDCARLAAGGLVRINRQPTDKPHARLRVGDVLTVPLPRGVLVVRVLALARRRGPAAQARLLFQEIAAGQTGEALTCASPQSPAYAGPESRAIPNDRDP